MTWVTVRQITSQSTDIGAYMNVREESLYVSVSMVVYKCPTYLIQDGIHAKLIQFDDQDMADEWLEEHKGNKLVTKLEDKPIAQEKPSGD